MKHTRPSPGRCPHADVRFCPLYVAMHIAGGPSCDDGQLDEGTCAVSRGTPYAALLGALMAVHPRVVAETEWQERAEEIKQQRLRNMRAAGVH